MNIFIISFLATSFIYSFLSAATKIFYKNKPVSELSAAERDILYDRANLIIRIGVFFINILGSFISPPVWIIAVLITAFFYAVKFFF